MLELKEVQRRYLEDIKINELHTEEQKSKINSEKILDVEHINKHNEVVLEEKAALIINLPLEQIVKKKIIFFSLIINPYKNQKSKKSKELLTAHEKDIKRKEAVLYKDSKVDLRKTIDLKDFKKEEAEFKGEFKKLYDNLKRQLISCVHIIQIFNRFTFFSMNIF